MSDRLELSETDHEGIAALLTGRRIVSAELGEFDSGYGRRYRASGLLVLDDGRRIYVIPNDGECSCGGGEYTLTHLASVDNIITSVRLAENETEDRLTRYQIFVVADATEINLLNVDGDDGSGYYGTGYQLVVTPFPPTSKGQS